VPAGKATFITMGCAITGSIVSVSDLSQPQAWFRRRATRIQRTLFEAYHADTIASHLRGVAYTPPPTAAYHTEPLPKPVLCVHRVSASDPEPQSALPHRRRRCLNPLPFPSSHPSRNCLVPVVPMAASKRRLTMLLFATRLTPSSSSPNTFGWIL
jgi:hypothetical protein